MSFNIPSPSMGEVFRNHYPFYVPKYQRGYAWETEELSDFIADINACAAKATNHFMGGLVQVHVSCANIVSRKHEVVDGQQRMATFSLAIASIIRALKRLAADTADGVIKGSCLAKSEEIQETFLCYKETRGASRIDVPKMELSRTDEDCFRALLSDTTFSPTRESHKRLITAFQSLDRELIQPILVGAASEAMKLQSLINLYEVLSQKCVVIHIVCESRPEAYSLFTVLNDRGRNLTDGDLLRARTLELLESSPRIQDEVERLWDSILDGKPEDIAKYLKAYFPSTTGRRAPSKDMFDAFVSEFLGHPTPESIKAFVVELAEDKPIFDAIRGGKWPFISGSKATPWDEDRLSRLVNTLQHEAAHPVLLSAARLGEKKFIEVVCLLERFVFRYITIVGAHPSPLYSPYNSEAKKMRQQHRTYQVDSLKSQLSTLITARADDDIFKDSLLTKLQYSDNTNRNREIRHFLTTLESYQRWFERGGRTRMAPARMPVYDVAATTLEHVYPKTADVSCQSPAMEVLKHKLANLTIMADSDNSVSGNDVFARKKTEYEKSSVGLTRRIAEFADWTPSEFTTRETELLNMAIAIFKI